MNSNTEYANPAVWIIEGLIVFFILYKIISARKGKQLYIRRISGLSSLDEAVGRATEMGKPIMFAPGLNTSTTLNIIILQAMAIMSHVIRRAAKYSTRVIVPASDPLIYTVAGEVAKDSYATEGSAEGFNADDIRYLSDDQFAWSSAVVGIIHREKPATALYFGHYAAESLILTENGQMVGAIQIAGTPSTTQVPFFLATCDYTIIGDEYYAASAYLSKEPTLLGSLVGQDYGKLLLVFVIILGMITITLLGLHTDNQPLIWFQENILTWIKDHFLKYFLKGSV